MIVTYSTGFRGGETHTIVINNHSTPSHEHLLVYIRNQCQLDYNARQSSPYYYLKDVNDLNILMIFKD